MEDVLLRLTLSVLQYLPKLKLNIFLKKLSLTIFYHFTNPVTGFILFLLLTLARVTKASSGYFFKAPPIVSCALRVNLLLNECVSMLLRQFFMLVNENDISAPMIKFFFLTRQLKIIIDCFNTLAIILTFRLFASHSLNNFFQYSSKSYLGQVVPISRRSKGQGNPSSNQNNLIMMNKMLDSKAASLVYSLAKENHPLTEIIHRPVGAEDTSCACVPSDVTKNYADQFASRAWNE